MSPFTPFSYRGNTKLCQHAEGCLPAPPPPFWNKPPASTHRCFLCSFLLPFFCFLFSSARHGFPSRWLRAQPNLFIHSSKTLGGRAPWGSGSPHSQGALLVPHWFFLSAGIHTWLCYHHRNWDTTCGLRVRKALPMYHLPCPWIMKLWRERARVEGLFLPGCGPPSGPP